MAITKTNRVSTNTTTDAATFTTGTYTPTASRILIATVMNTKATTPNAVNSFTDTNLLTWTSIHTVVDNGDLRRITQFWANSGASPVIGTAVADFNAVNQTSCYINITEYDGLNLAAPIGNVDVKNPTSGTSLVVALTFSNSANGIYVAIGRNADTGDSPAASACQSIATPTLTSPTTSLLLGWDSVNQASPGYTWTNSSARWGAGFELVAVSTGANWGPMLSDGLNRLVQSDR